MTALSDLLNSLNREKWSSREIENRADKAGQKVSYAAVSRYLAGNHPARPSAQVLAAFAAVFGTDVNRLREAAGQGPVSDRFELPAEADMLDPDERRAVVNLVRVMARRKAHHDHQGEAEPGPEAGSQEHGGEDRSPDGSTPGQPGAPISALQRKQAERDRRQREADAKPLDELLGLAADKGERMDQDDD